jgi:hypothetical protein
MNDLDSSTAGYEELAGPNGNEGIGWLPIGTEDDAFTGSLDGQGYEIRDLFINLPDEDNVGLFSIVGEGGRIEDIGIVNADVTSGAFIGSLVGSNNGTVSNSYSTGSVTGGFWVGGLVGFNFEEGTVSNSYSTGNVTGGYGIGGLAGGNMGTMSNSYSTCSVTGYEGAGGLLGANWPGTVSNCYSTGSVTGDINAWGLVGFGPGTVSNSFWDTQTSGQSLSPWGGTGKNTTEMKDISTFSGAHWDITAVALNETNPAYIWNIVNNVTYPFLSWQPV